MTRDKAKSSCPQCGAEVGLYLGDPLLQCRYCRTKLYMVPDDGIFSYILSPSQLYKHRVDHVLYLPYLRFKGFRFSLFRQGKIKTSHVDSTIPASEGLTELPSLGLAARISPLSLNTGQIPRPLPKLNLGKFLAKANKMIEQGLREKPTTSFIMGQNVSLIFAPFVIVKETQKGRIALRPLWTAGTRLVWSEKEDILLHAKEKATEAHHGHPTSDLKFIPLICPECGNDLPAISMASIPFCKYCGRLWPLNGMGLVPPRAYVLCKKWQPNLKFVPFYHFSIKLEGLPFDNRLAFLSRLLPYKYFPKNFSDEPIQLLVPAFRVNPSLYIRLGKRFTISETPFLASDDRIAAPISPACGIDLSLDAALQSLPLLLLSIMGQRRNLFENVKKTNMKIIAMRVLFMPFEKNGRELVELHTGQAIPEAAIRFGRNL